MPKRPFHCLDSNIFCFMLMSFFCCFLIDSRGIEDKCRFMDYVNLIAQNHTTEERQKLISIFNSRTPQPLCLDSKEG